MTKPPLAYDHKPRHGLRDAGITLMVIVLLLASYFLGLWEWAGWMVALWLWSA